MKVSYNWLKDYSAFSVDAEALADLLTMSGLEVEDLKTLGSSFDGIVVGRVLSVERHPDADRLTCCTVDAGAGEPLPIVCGAPNVAAGQIVPVATVGAVLNLPDRENPGHTVAVTIKKSKIRGQLSQGMICAEDELGLSDDHSGIMVLDDDGVVGEPFIQYLKKRGTGSQDHVIDVSITPNRPDAISHIGIARDISALVQVPLDRPEVPISTAGGQAGEMVEVQIDAPDGCGRYVAFVVKGVTIKESPAWMKERLTAIGLRPRNNVVDVTNYVMYECGQPLHAFDYDRIAGHKIIVRYNDEEKEFVTLDSKKRDLPDRTLLICDADRPVAIAGVMGGENSEVTDSTSTVLIESAYFDPSTIRRTARALGLQTDASYRFERGVDSDGQVWAAARAAQLIAELASGEVVDGMVDAHPAPVESPVVTVRHRRVAQIIGHDIDAATIERLLTAIGFEVKKVGSGEPAYVCRVPSFRPDIEREIDVIEEIGRLYGYDSLPEPAFVHVPLYAPHARPAEVLSRRARLMLQGLGFREVYTNSMLRNEVADAFNAPLLSGVEGDVVHTLKPISQEMAALRPSMLPGVLSVMAYNQNHGQRVLRFMEIGHIFHRASRAGAVVPGYAEHASLILALGGLRETEHWAGDAQEASFHDLKGNVTALLEALGLGQVRMEAVYEATPITRYHLVVKDRMGPLGVIARLSDEQTAAYDIKTPVFFAELDWDAIVLRAGDRLQRKYQEITRFPSVERDLAVIVDRNQDVGPLMDVLHESGGDLLQQVSVFDVYTGNQVPTEKKSVAFGLRFETDRTLEDREVDRAIETMIKALNHQYDAELRK